MAGISPFFFFFRVLLLFLAFSDYSWVQTYAMGVGINYGQIANNLPSHSRVAVLLKSLNISRVKLYDADPSVLNAFSNSDVEFNIGLGNELLPVVKDPTKAQNWIQQNVQPHISKTRITTITVGNEIFKGNDKNLMDNLLPAMKSVYGVLVDLKLDKQVTVTSAHSLDILGSSYPPSTGAFKEEFVQYFKPILDFHAQIDSPFCINAYPYFAYKDSPNEVSLDYVLFRPNKGMTDSATNLHYDNMLYAQIDAVYNAIKALGHTDIEVRVSETGWPSKGDEDEAGATPTNAGLYNGNLVKKLQEKQGTPAKPDVPVSIYVFALFNENMKPGPTSERNYGLYYPDESPVYNLGVQNLGVQGFLPEIIYEAGATRTNVLAIVSCLIFVAVYLIWV